jgi:signal transduction histidine kinase
VRSPLLVATLCFLAVGGLTLLIIFVPPLRFSVLLPRFRLVIEAAGAIVAILAMAVAYLHYFLTRQRLWVFVGCAFLVIGLNQLAFGVILPAQQIGARLAMYIWAAGRLMAALLFLAGALGSRPPRQQHGRPARVLFLATLAAVASLAAADGLLWIFGDRLPALTTIGEVLPPSRVTGVLPGLTWVDAVLALVGTALYLLAALAFVSRIRRRDETPSWLPAALVLAAFSHVHYALLPTVFTAHVSTGDLLRVVFSLVVLVGLGRDISKTYIMEHDRSARLADAYAEERERVRQLEEADRARAHLFEILTHELMHPVASIRGFVVTLTRLWDKLDDATRREFMSRLDRESDRLRSLSESAATAAELERAAFALNPRPERALDLVHEAAESTQDLGGRLQLRIELEENARVMADRARIQQVFGNLLSNAEKYAPGRERVDLSAEANESEVVFSLVDQGPGIGPEQHTRIFQRFSRVRPPGLEHVPGSGLGLYISREIVEAHGGRIWVESQPGAGASFRFTLPRTDTP